MISYIAADGSMAPRCTMLDVDVVEVYEVLARWLLENTRVHHRDRQAHTLHESIPSRVWRFVRAYLPHGLGIRTLSHPCRGQVGELAQEANIRPGVEVKESSLPASLFRCTDPTRVLRSMLTTRPFEQLVVVGY